MSFWQYFLWPYAAKAFCEYRFDGNLYYFWITFPFKMNTSLKPDLSKWSFYLDTSHETPYVSTWLDNYTLYFEVDVQDSYWPIWCEYDGPGPVVYTRNDPNRKTLETVWRKQWEPWGKIPCHNVDT